MVTRTVGVYEAKTKLPSLLKEVAVGNTITITRHGRPVARLMPIGLTDEERTRARRAIEEWEQYRDRHDIRLGPGITLRELIEEGRR